MSLKFKSPCFGIPQSILQETGTLDFLHKISPDFPIINGLSLTPLSIPEQKAHWQKIKSLLSQTSTKDLAQAWLLIQSIPLPEVAISGLESSQAGLTELTLLAKFFSSCQKLREVPSLKLDLTLLTELQNSIKPFLNDTASGYAKKVETEEYIKKLCQLEDEKNTLIQNWENEIRQKTGLKLTWPLPREFPSTISPPLDSNTADSLNLIQAPAISSGYVLYFSQPEALKEIENRHGALMLKIQNQTIELEKNALKTLFPLIPKIRHFYRSIQEMAWKIHLAYLSRELKLCIPEISQNLLIKQGRLTRLYDKDSAYQPLSFCGQNSVSLIFGSNMSGKTTVLKTILHLCLLALHGIPVPCQEFHLPPIISVKLHLKDSGNVELNQSSFASEMQFFANSDLDSLVLADELFQSTEPVCGSNIATLVIEDFRDRKLNLVTTTHYSEPIGISGINHFYMDSHFNALPLCEENLSCLLENHRQITLKLALDILPKNSSLSQKLQGLLQKSQNSKN